MIPTKTCCVCKIVKPITEFQRNGKRRRYNCKDCCSITKRSHYVKNADKMRAARTANPDNERDKHLRVRYGITIETFNAMKTAQNNACYLCCVPFEDNLRVCVDHCHTSGKVRALLCNLCNVALGAFKDNTEVMRKAVEYIELHQTETPP